MSMSVWTYLKLALGMTLVILLTMFVIQNASPIQVEFLAWETEISLALVVFVALLSGAILGVAFRSWQWWRSTKKSHAAGARVG